MAQLETQVNLKKITPTEARRRRALYQKVLNRTAKVLGPSGKTDAKKPGFFSEERAAKRRGALSKTLGTSKITGPIEAIAVEGRKKKAKEK
jgi:hypothetical protein